MIANRLAEVQQIIRDSGFRADVDPQNLDAPGVWIAARSIPDWTLCEPEVEIDVVLFAPDNGIRNAIKTLDKMLGTLIPVLGQAGASINRVSLQDTITLSGVGSPLPAYTIEITY